MSHAMSNQQTHAFTRDGFLLARGVFARDEIGRLSAAIDELASRPPVIGEQMAYFEDDLRSNGGRVLSRIERFVEYQPDLAAVVRDPRITDVVSELLGDHAVLFKDKINFKMPGGGGFTPHQDIQPGWDAYAPYYVSVLVAIDPNTPENGCIELAAGHHRRGLIGRKWQPLEGQELEGLTFTAYPMDPGDLVFFDCFAPHQSKPNSTGEPRRNLYLTYNRERDGDFRAQYFADKRKSYPPDFERDPNATYVFRV